MSGKIALPHLDCVSKWKEDKVIKWLKKVNLDDCIPAFEIRHIDGAKLLELNEQKLFTYQDLKIKHRKQIAKCVQECKSQASNAKRIAKTTLKHNHGAQSNVESNGTCDSSDYDTDYWGSDFEDESEEEVRDEPNFLEVNNNNIDGISGKSEKSSPASSVLSSNTSDEKSIPQPPDVPIIPKTVNGSPGFRSNLTTTIPRPPIKRPPSQPPPPPIPQPTSQEPQEDYEIPIVSPSSYGKESCSSSDSLFLSSPSIDNSNLDTYEIVEPPEENYEIVDAMPSMSFNMTDKPILPPRHSKSPESVSPPPLPQKPQKLRDNFIGTERIDGVRTFSRPKLPVKTETEPPVEVPVPSSLPSNVGFISSLMGRRPSGTPSLSPKTQHKKDSLDSSVTSPLSGKLFSNGLSSSSGSLDRESSPSLEAKKMVPLPPLPPRVPLCPSEDSIQNMATRPLPPVPAPVEEDKYNNQQDLMSCPWFQEIERGDAESAVKDLIEDGSFVVRPSKRAGATNPYSLTVLHEGKLFHLNIRLRPDGTYALGKEKEREKTFPSVPEMINFHLNEPILLKNRGESAGKTILHKYPEKT